MSSDIRMHQTTKNALNIIDIYNFFKFLFTAIKYIKIMPFHD